MSHVRVTSGGEDLFARIEPLWVDLRRHHADISAFWRDGLLGATFDARKRELLGKSTGGLLVLLASCDARDVGYAISTITAESAGEVDSLFVSAGYRRRRIGHMLMSRSMQWFAKRAANPLTVEVLAGNEDALRFYARYGFHSRTVRMRHVANDAEVNSP